MDIDDATLDKICKAVEKRLQHNCNCSCRLPEYRVRDISPMFISGLGGNVTICPLCGRTVNADLGCISCNQVKL